MLPLWEALFQHKVIVVRFKLVHEVRTCHQTFKKLPLWTQMQNCREVSSNYDYTIEHVMCLKHFLETNLFIIYQYWHMFYTDYSLILCFLRTLLLVIVLTIWHNNIVMNIKFFVVFLLLLCNMINFPKIIVYTFIKQCVLSLIKYTFHES